MLSDETYMKSHVAWSNSRDALLSGVRSRDYEIKWNPLPSRRWCWLLSAADADEWVGLYKVICQIILCERIGMVWMFGAIGFWKNNYFLCMFGLYMEYEVYVSPVWILRDALLVWRSGDLESLLEATHLDTRIWWMILLMCCQLRKLAWFDCNWYPCWVFDLEDCWWRCWRCYLQPESGEGY